MKQSSRMSIEYQSHNRNSIPFGELEVGDVFRMFDENRLYMVIRMPPDALVIYQGVCLDNGGRRVFNVHTACIQVKMVCSWVDMQP